MTSSTRDLQFYDLSHPWGQGAPLWPYFPDIKFERFHYHAKSGVLSQQATPFMHSKTHTDAPAHVIEGTEFIEVPLERAEPKIEVGDIVVINTGCTKVDEDKLGVKTGEGFLSRSEDEITATREQHKVFHFIH